MLTLLTLTLSLCLALLLSYKILCKEGYGRHRTLTWHVSSRKVSKPAVLMAEGRGSLKDYGLHRAAFHGDVKRIKEILEALKDVQQGEEESVVNFTDDHGNTALHIAVMLGHREVIEELLKNGALVKEKNILGWTPLDEALSYGNVDTVTLLLKKMRDQTTKGLIQRRKELIQSLLNLEDFYAELKWEFHTWVPFLSRLLPSDVVRIYKTGSCIRLNSTLGDFSEMKWSRGDLSFIFDGDTNLNSDTLSLMVLDNKAKEYQKIKLLGSEDLHTDLREHVRMLMSRPITYANMSTQPIVVTRAQSGWIFRVDKCERVGEYDTEVHNVTNLILIARKRREHLTPEQIQEQEQLRRKVESGQISESDLSKLDKEEEEEDQVSCHSIEPPTPNTVNWEEYISAKPGNAPRLGRKMDLKVDRKSFKATVCITQKCPIEIKKLLDILEVVAPYKHFHKLRQFVNLKLPPGFPVKLDIPVFPMVTAVVTLDKYEPCTTPAEVFRIPANYAKFVPKSSSEESNGSIS